MEELISDPDRNATAAAKRAGYSPQSAKSQAAQILTDPRVQNLIEETNKETAKRLGITQERIMQELANIGLANLKHIVTQDPVTGETSVRLAHLPDNLAASIQEVKVSKVRGTQTTSVKLADKRAALIDLAKMVGIYQDKVEVSGHLSLEDLIAKSYEIEASQKEVTPSE